MQQSTYGEELQEQTVLAIAELELEDSVGSHLRNGRQPPGLEIFAQPSDKGGRRRRSGPGEVGQVAAEAIVDQQLLLVIGFGEFEEQDLGGEVIDVRESQSHQARLELMRNDLVAVQMTRTGC